MVRRVHGIVKPSRRGNVPARVLNVQSKKRNENRKIRLDKLIQSEKPIICIKRRLGGIGDVIMTTPLLKAIKKLLPNCHLIYATDLVYAGGALAEVILHNPYVDSVISNDKINDTEYDYFVDITSTGLHREKAGSIPPNRIDMFAEEVGIGIESDPVPTYIVQEAERDEAIKRIKKEFLQDQERNNIQLIAIQARSNDARRTWPLEHVQKLTDLLAKDPNRRILLFDWGKSATRWKKSDRMFPILNETLPKTAAIIEQCDLVICPDSSLLHLAGALNKKIVSIFGPIPPESRINYYANAEAITLGLPCQYCLAGESSVLTKTGYKKLKDIEVGDVVKTAHGLYKPVTQLHKNKRSDRELYELEYLGSNNPIIATGEHKVLITKKEETTKNIDTCLNSNPQWTELKDVKPGDFVCLPRNKKLKTTTYNHFNDEDRYWLLGLYLAVGIKAFENKSKQDNSTQVWINSKEITGLFLETFGKNKTAATKSIPEIVKTSETKNIRAFLDGYFSGDGYLDTKEKKVYTTKSRQIAYGIQELYTRLGILACVYHRTRDTNYKKNTDIYRVYVYDRERKWTRWCADKDYIYTPVKENNKSIRKDEFVYDITIKDDPTFTVDNIAINDCWYSPRCVRSNSSKLDCLTRIPPEMVYDAAIKRLAADYVAEPNIKYGQNMTKTGGQDPIILVKRVTDGMGDLIMATTGIEALKRKFTNKKIHVAVKKKLHPILKNNPYIDKVLDLEDSINVRRYYMVIDISYPCARYEIARLRSKKAVEKNRVEIFAEATGTRELISDLKPKFYISEEEKKDGRAFLKQHNIDTNKKTIAIATHSAEIYRDWPKNHYEELIKLIKNKYNIVILHSERTEFYDNTIDACGLPLRKAAGILSQCDGLITVDTGLLHIAAAIDLPTIALFGPIDYRARCKGYKNTTVIVSDLNCIPCWRNATIKCKQTNLVKSYSQCMKNITPKQVSKVMDIKFNKKDIK